MTQDESDMQVLMALPEFKRFLFRAIQTAGIMTSATNGHDGRDLAFAEGRKSLGLWMMHEADTGLPSSVRSPNTVAVWHAIMREQMQSSQPRKDKGDASRTDRYAELDRDGDE